MKLLACAALALSLTVAFAAEAPKKPPTFITVEEAGPDYKIQGEYAQADLGIQVIALGNGKFRAVFHNGGLPGGGWDGKEKTEIEGNGGKFEAQGYAVTADGTTLAGKGPKGEIAAKKIVRESPTLGAKPPEGAVVLFDGATADPWEGGKVDGRGFLQMGCSSKLKFNNFTLHIEFMTPFMPTATGQARGNSGVYLQKRYEVQVLDSFGLKGVDNECGGLYKNAGPKVNMCLPPLQWQTYDIDFTAAKWEGDKKVANAKLTVKHNGVTIHQDQELKDKTGGGEKESPAPAGLLLQNHGNPVFYKNIWVVEKK